MPNRGGRAPDVRIGVRYEYSRGSSPVALLSVVVSALFPIFDCTSNSNACAREVFSGLFGYPIECAILFAQFDRAVFHSRNSAGASPRGRLTISDVALACLNARKFSN